MEVGITTTTTTTTTTTPVEWFDCGGCGTFDARCVSGGDPFGTALLIIDILIIYINIIFQVALDAIFVVNRLVVCATSKISPNVR